MDCLFSLELGDGLAAFGNGVLGKIAWENKADGGLDFAGAEGVAVVHVNEAGTFASNAFENISNKGVHNHHGLVRDTNVWVNLFENFEDVRGESFGALLVAELLVLLVNGGGDFFFTFDGWFFLGWGLSSWLLGRHIRKMIGFLSAIFG